MIPRQELKARAKAQLGNSYFNSLWLTGIGVCFLGSIIIGAANIVPAIGTLLLMGPITYGMSYIFLKQARDGQPANIGDIFKGITEHFVQTFLIGFMSGLFVALWSLLFVIPGIIKAIDYALVYYIKADHPEYEWKTCLDESARIMKPYRGEYFVLILSFIPFAIVSSLCLGIGSLWLLPYMQATMAHFYLNAAGAAAPQQAYGAPQYNAYQQSQQQYGAPQQDFAQQGGYAQPQYGAQPQYDAQPQYQAPQQPAYEAPQPQYQAPQQPAYEAPQPQYQAPQQPAYDAPQPQYQAPQQPAPHAPGQNINPYSQHTMYNNNPGGNVNPYSNKN